MTRAYLRPRAYVRVRGPEAADFLQRMLSNDVLAEPVCEALLLTPKARRQRGMSKSCNSSNPMSPEWHAAADQKSG